MRHLKSLFFFAFASLFTFQAQAQIDIDLRTEGLPDNNVEDAFQSNNVKNQDVKPSIRVFQPHQSASNHMTIVCLPGGGYTHLATEHEGYDWAPYFCNLGFTFVVLKYRMPNEHKELPYSDVSEAFRVVRKHAKEWNIDDSKIGIMGSSAGGHLASTYATRADSLTKPYFQILFYPVISMEEGKTHQGSREHLLGKNPTKELICAYSNAQQVTHTTPQAIILLSDDDKAVPSINGVEYYLALKKKHIPASLHVYPSGGHGWGYRETFTFHNEMLSDLTAWIKCLIKK